MNLRKNKKQEGLVAQKYDQVKRERDAKKREKQSKKKRRGRGKAKQEKHERLNKIAKEEVAEYFNYNDIINAYKSKGKDGSPVHRGLEVYGYLETQYPDYKDLLDEYILDRACFFAKKDFKPEIQKVMSKFWINRYVKTGVKFIKEYKLKLYPNRPFTRTIFLAPKNLRTHINWMIGKEEEIDGRKIKMNVGHVHLDGLGWSNWNRPMILVSSTAGINTAIYKAQLEAKHIKEEMVKILHKIVHVYRIDGDIDIQKLNEFETKYEKYQKLYSDLKHDYELEIRKPMFEQPPSFSGTSKINLNNKFLLIFVFIGILISIILGVIF